MYLLGDSVRETSVAQQWRRLDELMRAAGLAYRDVARGEAGALERLERDETEWRAEGEALARALVARGGRRRLRRLSKQRRKLASLLTGGDVAQMWRYVDFIDGIHHAGAGGSGSEDDD
jgi:hypothetical protein